MIVNAFRFFIDHRLGRVDKSGHGKPEALGAVQDPWPGRHLSRDPAKGMLMLSNSVRYGGTLRTPAVTGTVKLYHSFHRGRSSICLSVQARHARDFFP